MQDQRPLDGDVIEDDGARDVEAVRDVARLDGGQVIMGRGGGLRREGLAVAEVPLVAGGGRLGLQAAGPARTPDVVTVRWPS